MSRRLVYVVGADGDLAAKVTVNGGKVLLNLPNYTLVHASPQKPEAANEYCYALEVEEANIHEVCDEPGVPVLRLWSGPKDSRMYTTNLVTCYVHCLDNPLNPVNKGAVAEAKEQKAKLQEAEALQDELRKKEEAAHKKVVQLENDLMDMAAVKKEQEEQIAMLQNELLGVRTDVAKEQCNTKTLAAILRGCNDEVLEALPYIGTKNLQYLRRWCEEQLAATEAPEGSDEG